MDLDDETAFKDIGSSEPASPELNDDDGDGGDDDDDDDYHDDDDDDDDDYHDDDNDSEHSKKVYRGKGVIWSICTESSESLPTIEAVKLDARASNLSKLGASTYNSHTYVCRSKGCKYKQKYKQSLFDGPFTVYFSGTHIHSSEITGSNKRGLSISQKAVVEEAFTLRMKSARNIIELFRSKRSRLTTKSEIEAFPPDPQRRKVNNYIQAFKKKNGSIYNPTPHHLESWCESHSSSSVSIDNEESFNTPFVLDFTLVSNVKRFLCLYFQ
jgi:hypothetical protein